MCYLNKSYDIHKMQWSVRLLIWLCKLMSLITMAMKRFCMSESSEVLQIAMVRDLHLEIRVFALNKTAYFSFSTDLHSDPKPPPWLQLGLPSKSYSFL